MKEEKGSYTGGVESVVEDRDVDTGNNRISSDIMASLPGRWTCARNRGRKGELDPAADESPLRPSLSSSLPMTIAQGTYLPATRNTLPVLLDQFGAG